MWERAELKAAAKNVLSKTYWWGFLAYLIFVAINALTSWIPGADIAAIFFLYNPLSVGLCKYFMNMRKNDTNLSELFYAFACGDYIRIVGSMAWMFLFEFLWFLIPVAGIVMVIIKSISYSMTPFIVADNPGIKYDRALKLSMAMTDGQKADIFVLWLSFIGWFLLACLTCGIGFFFLTPYIMSTYSELYIRLRANAFNRGICTPEELHLR